MSRVQGVVFDLDDTLYWERDYVHSGFAHIAMQLDRPGATAEEVLSFLWDRFLVGERGNLFDQLLARYEFLADTYAVPQLVALYRAHRPALRLSTQVQDLLTRLQNEVALALITDGYEESQEAKIEALALHTWIPCRVVTGAWGAAFWKPHPRAYETVMSELDVAPGALVYVADNPGKDFVTPNKLGWQTIRLRNPAQLHYDKETPDEQHRATSEVASIAALERTLMDLCS